MLLTIDHIADFNRRYPGETVTFWTRVRTLEPVPGFTLSISLPLELTPGAYHWPCGYPHSMPDIEIGRSARCLVWRVKDNIPAGTNYEYQLEAQIAPLAHDTTLESRAEVTVDGPGQAAATETAAIAVSARSRYLRHLPALYTDNDLLARFLMLFESFWQPIEAQIGYISSYFDPQLTTPDFLPWLAAWIGLSLDERWPEARQRQLLRAAASLYRRRGTRSGLQEFLEIYTGGQVNIVENRAENFQLGRSAKLGPGIALGQTNRPYSFTVTVYLPPVETANQTGPSWSEQTWRRTLEAIIQAEKPAHTSYSLRLETL
ncbi:MAG: phage tail protein [Chloroflexota bacterium]